MLSQITPMLLTYNEAPNVGRTLQQLRWASRIVIVDSFSTDATLEIARQFPQVEIRQRTFDSFAAQCNFGLDQVHTPWVLSMDADYVLSDELVSELSCLKVSGGVCGFQAFFQYWVCGRPLRASLYPPRTVLYLKERARYENDGHGHRVKLNGPTSAFNGLIYHDDRKSLSRWLAAQDSYAKLEAEKLTQQRADTLGFNDRVRKTLVLGPPAVFAYTLFLRALVLDGWPGWYYTFQRVLAEGLLSLRLIERLLGSDGSLQHTGEKRDLVADETPRLTPRAPASPRQ